MKNKFSLLFLIFFLALFLRFINLTAIPNGFNQDEAAIGYNAYSILKTGKDEYGIGFPVYFKSFGDQKLPAYIYLTALVEKFFGPNEFAVRFSSALLGSLTVIFMFFIVKELAGNEKIALLSSLFLSLNPWHLFFSRAAFEDNIALAFTMFGVWMFLKAVNYNWLYLFPSILGFVLSLYSYNVTRLLSPLIFMSLIFFNWKQIKKIPSSVKLTSVIFFALLLIPFILTFFGKAGAVSAKGALITSMDIQAKGLELRSYLVGTPINFLSSFLLNKYVFMLWQYVLNLIASLSVLFYFISGSTHGSQGIGNNGVFYLFEFPLILIGLHRILRERHKKLYFFIIWFVIAWLTLSLSKEVPHATRGYFLVIPLEVFSSLGLYILVLNIFKIKNKLLKYSSFIAFALFCFYNLFYFYVSYSYRFPLFYASGWHEQDKAVAEYIRDNEKKYKKIVFDNSAGYNYASLVFFTSYPPEEFQKTVNRLPDDSEGFSKVKSFGKFVWKDIDWKNDLKPETLIITSGKYPENLHPSAVFSYPQIPVVFSLREKIVQYPSSPVAYVAIENK